MRIVGAAIGHIDAFVDDEDGTAEDVGTIWHIERRAMVVTSCGGCM